MTLFESKSPSTALFLALLFALGTLAADGPARAVSSPSVSEEGDSRSLSAEDFAIGRPLQGDSDRLLQSVLLDYDVYRQSVEPGLADIRVFDAVGEPTPYAIRRKLGRGGSSERVEQLPLFALDGIRLPPDSDSTPQSGDASFAADDYRIEAQLNEKGAIVRVERGSDGATEPAGAWLVDATNFRDPIVGLEFDVTDTGEDHLVRLRVESSNDLARWKSLNADIVLVRLTQGPHTIERSSFAIPANTARYFRVTPLGSDPSIGLEGVNARLRRGNSAPHPRLRHQLEGTPVADRPGVFSYDIGRLPSIERMRITLPVSGTIVEGRIETASTANGPWRSRWTGLLYSIDRHGPVRNPAIGWPGGQDRFLRLVPSPRGGGLPGGAPTLEVEWRAEQLIYVDRGQGDSMLAIGRLDTDDASFAVSQLMAIAGVGKGQFKQQTAQLGPARTLAGEVATTRVVPIPWRTYGLWAVLLVVVALVVGMSIRLLRAGAVRPE